MKLAMPYLDLGTVEIAELLAYVARQSEDDWTENTVRQRRYNQHGFTQSIIIQFADPQEQDFKTYPRQAEFLPLLAPIEGVARQYYRESMTLRSCMIVRLNPRRGVQKHNDIEAYFHRVHRFHVPIMTHPDVIYELGNEYLHIPPGRLIEINNVEGGHGCQNWSDKPRVHLIFDLEPNAPADH